MKVNKVSITDVKENPNNPRIIKDDKFKKLVKSIKEFPQMLDIRPIVVNADMIVLGGNQRYKACKDAGLKEIPIIVADDLTPEQQQEFIIKDNLGYGEWEWNVLFKDWDKDLLTDWGMDLPAFEEKTENENPYTKKIEAPIYEPSTEKPLFKETYDDTKFKEIIEKIEASSLDKEYKEYLKLCATRHIVFNYQKIADLYAHSNKEAQELMEYSALVIIDFDKAIELGYVKLGDKLSEQYQTEIDDEE